MKSGMFPGQQEALRELARKGLKYEGVARRQRRMFLGMCFGTAAVGAGAYWAGRSHPATERTEEPHSPDPVLHDKLAQLRRIAVAADDDLFAARPLFLVGLDAFRTDTVLWCGFQRLARMAVVARDHLLAARMMKTANAGPVPSFVEPSLAELRPLAR